MTNDSAPSSIQVRGFQAAVHAAATGLGSGQRELVDCVVESEDALAVQRWPTPAPAIRAGVRTFLRPVVAPPLRLAGGRAGRASRGWTATRWAGPQQSRLI